MDQAIHGSSDSSGTLSQHQNVEGMIVSQVGDLLFGGCASAERSLMDVGAELGFREVHREDFVWCGKRFTRREDATIAFSMRKYHRNLKEIHVPKHKQLRALLGSFQWLVAQLRFDLAFQVSSLQGDKPHVGTLLRAIVLCREFKSKPTFEQKFHPVNPFGGGLLVVTDSLLAPVLEVLRLPRCQACYYILLADADLMAGRAGSCDVLDMHDMRSRRMPRVCHSSYTAGTIRTEEAFDVGQLCRGLLATPRGYSMHGKDADASLNSVPLTVVIDPKDVHDKGNNDTSSASSLHGSELFCVVRIPG